MIPDVPIEAVRRETSRARQLGAERLITYSRHSRPHQDLLRLMQSYGVAEARVSCGHSLAAMIQLTRTGFGVAAMPPALVADLLEKGVLRRLDGLETPPPLPFVIAWRTGTNRAENLVDIAAQTVRKFAERVGKVRRVSSFDPHCQRLTTFRSSAPRRSAR